MTKVICSIIKNEQKYLKEWIEWNLAIGFTHIHLYEDYGSESHKYITDSYDNVFLHSIEEIDIPRENYLGRQQYLFQWFVDNYYDIYNWCAFIDVDEFINFEDGYDMDKLCEEFQNEKGIYLYWKMFGGDGNIIYEDKPVVERFRKEVKPNGFDNMWCCKSFCRIDLKPKFINVHVIEGLSNTFHMKVSNVKCYHKVWINHYYTKSFEEWCNRIYIRGDVFTGNRKFYSFFDYNQDILEKLPNKDPNLTLEQINKILIDNGSKNTFNISKYKYKVGILVRCYNNSNTIIKCLSSVIKQTYKNIKVILVDDCSTDDTYEKASVFLSSLGIDNIAYRNQINLGNGGALRQCINLLNPNEIDYVMLIDSDDTYSDPNAIQVMLDNIVDGDYDLVKSNIKSNGKVFATHCQCIWKTSELKKINIVPVCLHEDQYDDVCKPDKYKEIEFDFYLSIGDNINFENSRMKDGDWMAYEIWRNVYTKHNEDNEWIKTVWTGIKDGTIDTWGDRNRFNDFFRQILIDNKRED